MSKRFSKKNTQKYVVVHRPHDDPNFYDTDASAHVLVPVDTPTAKSGPKESQSSLADHTSENKLLSDDDLESKEHVGEAALYGITFDDSKYDYTKHLKPIGSDPENALFIPAKSSVDGNGGNAKKSLEDLLTEPRYMDAEDSLTKDTSVFQRGVAKPEYLMHQQNVTEDIRGFKPDMNPALREVLEALEDDAYVVNDDIVVAKPLKEKSGGQMHKNDVEEEEDDLFAELLGSGEAQDENDFEDKLDEWDIDNLGNYEEEHYREEMANFDNVENLDDLRDIDYQADVRRFQREQTQHKTDNAEDEFANQELESEEPESEDHDVLAELPSFDSNAKTSGNTKRKQRRKKGAMSDVSGFSMTSSAIARTETMTVLDDKYDQIIASYENYQEEQDEDEEETYEPFDMKNERSDFESLLDDFLDNYELDKGGRKIFKKDDEIDKLKHAADEVSKGKLSMRRNRERQEDQKKKKKTLNKVTNTLSGLHL